MSRMNNKGWYKAAQPLSSKEADVNWDHVRKGLGWGAGLGAIPLAVGLMNPPNRPAESPQAPQSIVNQDSPKEQLRSPSKEIASPSPNAAPTAMPQASQGLPGDQELSSFIEPFEGNVPYAYKDSKGVPTIGIGFNLLKPGAKEKISSLGLNYDKIVSEANLPKAQRTKLSPQQVQTLFKADVQTAISDAQRWIPNLSSHPKPVQLVAIDLAFNMGASTLSQFKNTKKLIEEKKYESAAQALQQSKWYSQVQDSRSHGHCQMLMELGDQAQSADGQ